MAPFYGHAIDMWNLIFADHWMIRESHKFVTAIGYSEKFNPQVVRLGMAWDYNWVTTSASKVDGPNSQFPKICSGGGLKSLHLLRIRLEE